MDSDSVMSCVKELSKPVKKLIDVASKGVGTLYHPVSTTRQAKADAEALIIKTKAEIESLDLWGRANHRERYLAELRQNNVEKILSIAIDELPETVSEDQVDPDWVIQFFNIAQDVSDKEMQVLWARILAGQTTTPQSYQKRTLQFLQSLEKEEAISFSLMCNFAFKKRDEYFIFTNDFTFESMRNKVINGAIWHFGSIGLFDTINEVVNVAKNGQFEFDYFDRKVIINHRNTQEGEWPSIFGVRNFTKIGCELYNVSGSLPNYKYLEELKNFMESKYDVEFIIS